MIIGIQLKSQSHYPNKGKHALSKRFEFLKSCIYGAQASTMIEKSLIEKMPCHVH